MKVCPGETQPRGRGCFAWRQRLGGLFNPGCVTVDAPPSAAATDCLPLFHLCEKEQNNRKKKKNIHGSNCSAARFAIQEVASVLCVFHCFPRPLSVF